MSKRYGRNQRRAHREEIAALREKLYGNWSQAKSGRLTIDKDIVEVQVTDRQDRYSKTKEASIVVHAKRSIMDAAVNARRLNFDGFEWIITSIQQRVDGVPGNLALFDVGLSAFVERK